MGAEDGPFVHPDVSVTRSEADRTAQKFSRYPCLIVEVISPGTEAYDRGGKFTLYRRLKTLQEYMLVGSETKTVEVFRLTDEGTWMFIPYAERDEIELASVGIVVPFTAVYADVVLEQPEV